MKTYRIWGTEHYKSDSTNAWGSENLTDVTRIAWDTTNKTWIMYPIIVHTGMTSLEFMYLAWQVKVVSGLCCVPCSLCNICRALLLPPPPTHTHTYSQTYPKRDLYDHFWVHYEYIFFKQLCIVPLGLLPWEIQFVFSEESQLQQSRATQPKVHAGHLSVSIVHWTLIWTTGS